ncbi:MAG: phosphotransferase, partial [Bacteroidota bacterium]|nr:phosphotransferase [Bacteroidota bacterium]
NAGQAFEAASQFGLFTRLLSGFPSEKLHITLPHFHNLALRYQQFQQALLAGNPRRISESKEIIEQLGQHTGIVTEYMAIVKNPFFIKRVTHHDTKISNVLFDAREKAICVIDLDTLMPGYFISDVGDMMRTYLCTVSEEEPDFSKIHIRDDVYWAIVDGYAAEMNAELTKVEKNYFFYAGKYMIYMQALRFITDYLNEDVYYGAKYPQQNFVRAGNQLVLLQRLLEKESLFQ